MSTKLCEPSYSSIGLGERMVKELNLIPQVRTVEVISYLEH